MEMNLLRWNLILILLYTTLVHCDPVSSSSLLDSIEVPALGRVAQLGEFYDVRSEKFLHLPIFKTSLPENSTQLTENQATSLKYTLVNTYEEKFDLMDISAEMQISVLSGLVKLKGSGRFFKDTKTSAKSAKACLVQTFSNVYEGVSMLDSSLQPVINFDFLSKIDATHVVVGVQWGGNIFISVEDSNKENRDVQEIQGELRGTMDKLKSFLSSVSAGGKISLNEKDLGKFNTYSFTIDGDLVPKSVPQTILDALEFMKESPQLLLNANEGKGKPMKYFLLPLEGLKKFWDVQSQTTNLMKRIDEVTIQNCVRLFDEMSAVSQKVNDVHRDVSTYEKYLPLKHIEEMNDLKNDFHIFSTELTSNLSQLLIKVRSGEEPIYALNNVLHDANKYHRLWQKSNFPMLTRRQREISFIDSLQKHKILVFHRQVSLGIFLWENYHKHIYMFFFNYDDDILSDKKLHNFKFIVDQKMWSNTTEMFVATNYEFVSDDEQIAESKKANKICTYRNGEIEYDDFPSQDKYKPKFDPGSWSLKQMQKHVEDARKRFNSLQKNPRIPIGFSHVQLPFQPEPSVLWKGTKWQDISSKYAGLFFRTVGGGAAPFGQAQEEFAPTNRILNHNFSSLNITSHQNITSPEDFIYLQEGNYNVSKKNNLSPNGWSDGIFVGLQGPFMYIYYGTAECIGFYSETKTGEVRPKNTAVKIWKRD